jgi:CRP/FNR family cyclic AMP-dependent transcriptional regulator
MFATTIQNAVGRTMSADLAMLAEVPVFALLDERERESLAAMLEPRTFPSNTVIFEYGDAGDNLYIVRRGRVEVFIESTEGVKIVLGENCPGDVFGEISLLDGGARTATAVTIEDTETLTLDRDQLLEFLTLHPHASLDLLTVMGRRLRATDELLRSQVTRNVNKEEEDRLTFGERIADHVASFGGSWTFIISFAVVLVGWVTLNTIVLARRAFDPFPYILLNLFLSMLAAIQAPVIMMSQNRQAFKDRLKADLEYDVNLKAELEVANLHQKVDRIYEALQSNFSKLDRKDKDWGRLT